MAEIKRIEAGARMSRAVIHNGVAYLAGMTAGEKTPDIRAQTRDVLKGIEKRLAEAGTDKSRLLTAQIWLKDIKKDFAGMNEVWDAWVVPGNPPTRATAQCELALPEILVEIIVTAAA